MTTIEYLLAGHETATALVGGILVALFILWMTKLVNRWWQNQVSLVGFIDTDDGSMLPLRNTRGDKRVRIAGRHLLATKVVVTRFERGYPVYREV